MNYVAGRLQLVSSAPSEQSWTLSQIWCSVIHLPSTHRNSPLGQGDVCECGIETKTHNRFVKQDISRWWTNQFHYGRGSQPMVRLTQNFRGYAAGYPCTRINHFYHLRRVTRGVTRNVFVTLQWWRLSDFWVWSRGSLLWSTTIFYYCKVIFT